MIDTRRFTHRRFNADRYLDEQLEQPAPFRPWAVRLNDWCERKLDAVDWIQLEIHLGSACGVLLTGFALYMAYVVVDAWLQGRFHLGGN